MISIPIAFLVGAVCVCIEGFFSGSEIAMVSADRARLRARAAEGDRGARLAEDFLARPEVFLATTLMGTNLATITFSVTVAIALLGAGYSGALLAIAMVTPMTLIFGEIIPKTVFQQHADRLVPRIIYPLHVASVVFRPMVWLVGGFAAVMSRLLRTDRKRAFITRDELTMLIEATPEDEGEAEITRTEREMIANVFELSEDQVYDVMVPLSEVTALPENTTVGEAALEVADKQHSRMPVFRSRVDDIVGVVHLFDLLAGGPAGKGASVSEIARPAMFVPETMPAVDLLVELQVTGHHMAIVVDEYGGAVGICTVEDILEEIVGEIEDEYDVEPSPITQERPGVWRVEARTSVERINSELELDLPESDDYETIAGLILEHFKRIPDQGESLVQGIATIRVTAVSDRAIEQVQILRRRPR